MSTEPVIDSDSIAAFRFGFGLPLPDGAPVDAGSMLARLTAPDPMDKVYPPMGLAEVEGVTRLAQEARMAARQDPARLAEQRAALQEVMAVAQTIFRRQMARAIDSPDGLRERLVRFWADHFTVVARNRQDLAVVAAHVDDAIRPHVAGRFEDLLTAAVLHPAMLIYLDQVASVGPTSRFGQRRGRGLNENLARELLELHTLGAGSGYTQEDVRELAELLTGLRVDPGQGLSFDAGRAEPGAETVLGQRYEGAELAPIRAVLRDLARRPETARHIAGKLVTHFLTDAEEPALVASLAEVWMDSTGDLAAVTGAMLNEPAFWRPEAAKARSPMEFLIAALRALAVTGADVVAARNGEFRRMILDPLTAMGQPPRGPAGPDGWPEALTDWITPQGMAARISWAMAMPERIARGETDPQTVMARALGGRASPALVWAVQRAESRPEAVGLLLSAPEFNRR